MANAFDDFLKECDVELVGSKTSTRKGSDPSEELSNSIQEQIRMAKIDADAFPIDGIKCAFPNEGGKGRPKKWYKFDDSGLVFTTYYGNSKLGNPFRANSWNKLIDTLYKIDKAAKDGKFNQIIADLVRAKREKGAATRAKTKAAATSESGE